MSKRCLSNHTHRTIVWCVRGRSGGCMRPPPLFFAPEWTSQTSHTSLFIPMLSLSYKHICHAPPTCISVFKETSCIYTSGQQIDNYLFIFGNINCQSFCAVQIFIYHLNWYLLAVRKNFKTPIMYIYTSAEQIHEYAWDCSWELRSAEPSLAIMGIGHTKFQVVFSSHWYPFHGQVNCHCKYNIFVTTFPG